MSKRRQGARQDVLLLTSLGDMVGLEMETEPDYIVSPDTVEAWHQDYNQQAKDKKKGRVFQVISERFKNPIKIYKNRKPLEGQTTEVIASQTQDSELAFMNSRREKNKMLIWVAIIAALFAVIISIVVLVRLKASTSVPVTPAVPVTTMLLMSAVGAGKPKSIIQVSADLKEYNQKDTGNVQCLVIVEKTGALTYPKISNTLIPDDSIQRYYKGKPAHLLGLDTEGKLWAIEPDNVIMKNESPKDLFIALQYEKEVNAIYSLSEGMIEKIKIGFFFLLCFIELIVLFLIITAATGGVVK